MGTTFFASLFGDPVQLSTAIVVELATLFREGTACLRFRCQPNFTSADLQPRGSSFTNEAPNTSLSRSLHLVQFVSVYFLPRQFKSPYDG